MPAEIVERVDAWRKRQPAKTSMSAAVVALVLAGLTAIDSGKDAEVKP